MAKKASHIFNTAAGRVSIYTSTSASVSVTSSSTWTSVTISPARAVPAPADDFSADPLWTPTAKDRKTTAEQMKRDIENAKSAEDILSKRYPPSDYRKVEMPLRFTAPQDPPYVPEMPSFPPARFLKY